MLLLLLSLAIILLSCLCVYSCLCFKEPLPEDLDYYDRSRILNRGDSSSLTQFDMSSIISSGQQNVVERIRTIENTVIQKRVIEKHPNKKYKKPLTKYKKPLTRNKALHYQGNKPRSTRNNDGNASPSVVSMDTPPDDNENIKTDTSLTFSNSDESDNETNDTFPESAMHYSNNNKSTSEGQCSGHIQLVDTPPDDDIISDVSQNLFDSMEYNDRVLTTGGRKGNIAINVYPSSFAHLSSSFSSIRSKLSNIGSRRNLELYTTETCFICLEKYEVGDKIYWSPNDRCVHSFHAECMNRWLLKNNDCPLCRQDYLLDSLEESLSH